MLLAMVNFSNPTTLAVLIAWILSVVLHELAHGIVAYLGGDYTIRERGGLTLNPFQYIDPVVSIILPTFLLLTGGVPLPGGVTYIHTELLRSRLWESAVSLAGPATNVLLFLLLILPFQPKIGWIQPVLSLDDWSQTAQFLATMATLQFVVSIINLVPLPPLDGFGIIRPYFDEPTRRLLTSREVNLGGLIVLFLLLRQFPAIVQGIYGLEDRVLDQMGVDPLTVHMIGSAFNRTLFNQ